MTQTDEVQNSVLGKAQGYLGLLTEIKKRIHSAQYEALKAVNRELVGLYWDIGRMIVERQNSEGWGRSVVEKLSADLRREFPGVGGFSVQNLWYMRQFYSEYHDNERLQPLVGEIAWAHNLAIMSKCKDPLEREFYVRPEFVGKMQFYLDPAQGAERSTALAKGHRSVAGGYMTAIDNGARVKRIEGLFL